MAKLKVFVNGAFLDEDERSLTASDRGFLLGDGLFETLRAYDGRPFLLKEHLERMSASAQFLGIAPPADFARCGEIIARLIAANDCPQSYIRITMSRGLAGGGLVPVQRGPSTLSIIARPVAEYPARLFEEGAVLKLVPWRRSASDPLAAHKTTSYLPCLLARMECQREPKADEALILNTRGAVCECAAANFFACKEGRVFTPPVSDRLLPGVTRAAVISIAAALGIPCAEESLFIDPPPAWDECFITNSIMEIMPVKKIISDKQTIWENHAPGPLTARLREAYRSAALGA